MTAPPAYQPKEDRFLPSIFAPLETEDESRGFKRD
jgi:hypothetical protein